MKVYLHYEGEPDLTLLLQRDDLHSLSVKDALALFADKFNTAHSATPGAPSLTPQALSLSTNNKAAKAAKQGATLASIAREGADLFVHVDADKLAKPAKPVAMRAPQEVRAESKLPQVLKSASPKPVNVMSPDVEEKFMDAVDKFVLAENYAKAREMCESALQEFPKMVSVRRQLAKIARAVDDWQTEVDQLELCLVAARADVDLLMEMGKAYVNNQDLQEALTTFQRGLVEASAHKDKHDPRDFEAAIADLLRRSNRSEEARQIVVKTLQSDQSHMPSLLVYGELLMDRNTDLDEQMKVFLRVLMQDTTNKKLRMYVARLLDTREGKDFVRNTLLAKDVASASALVFLGNICKDESKIEAATELLRGAFELGVGESPMFFLPYLHILELDDSGGNTALAEAKRYLKKEAKLTVAGLSCEMVGEVLADVSDLDFPSEIPFLAEPFVTPNLPKGGKVKQYPDNVLQLLACYFTLLKLLYVAGRVGACCKLVYLLAPLQANHKLHTTSIRNENAYFNCVSHAVAHVPRSPAPANCKVLYVVGDSHCLSGAWQRVRLGGEDHVLRPMLVTGCKIWHLRNGSTFYPKHNFERVMRMIPKHSKVMFLFGEIDCREGFLRAVQKCRFKTVNDAVLNTVKMYLQVLKDSVRKYDVALPLVHPVPPVLNETRQLVLQFNGVLGMHVGVNKKSGLKFLDIVGELVDGAQTALRPEFGMDDTHLHPGYVQQVLQPALDRL